MAREIILDTETTGFEPSMGHRMVEIACLEIDDFMPTGRSFHTYIDPCRDMPPDAQRVHGLSGAFLRGKPKFDDPAVVDAFIDFIGDAPLIAHNAEFDRAFINHELQLCSRAVFGESRFVDTLALARVRFPGMHNSLDALCKRFKISLADREKHGALIDARLLAEVYLELKGGRERRLELGAAAMVNAAVVASRAAYGARPRPLIVRATEDERRVHASFIRDVVKSEVLWMKFGI